MENTKIAKCKIEEAEALLKCFRRVLAYGPLSSLPNRLNEAKLLEDVKEGNLFILKQNKRVLGALQATSSWGKALFKEGSTYKKEMDVLDGFPYAGERIVLLDYLFIDPTFLRKKYGKSLMDTLFRRYEETSFLVSLGEEDCLAFFEKMGFHHLYLEKDLNLALRGGQIYVRPNVKEGLCSKPIF